MDLLMVQHVVVAGVGEQQSWRHLTQQVDRFTDSWLVEGDMHVGFVETVVRRTDLRGGVDALLAADRSDFGAPNVAEPQSPFATVAM